MAKRQSNKKIWFRAKNYGWGWYPVTWEGWSVLIIFVILEIFFIMNVFFFVPGTVLSILALIFICYKTGEKPGWRWGKKK